MKSENGNIQKMSEVRNFVQLYDTIAEALEDIDHVEGLDREDPYVKAVNKALAALGPDVLSSIEGLEAQFAYRGDDAEYFDGVRDAADELSYTADFESVEEYNACLCALLDSMEALSGHLDIDLGETPESAYVLCPLDSGRDGKPAKYYVECFEDSNVSYTEDALSAALFLSANSASVMQSALESITGLKFDIRCLPMMYIIPIGGWPAWTYGWLRAPAEYVPVESEIPAARVGGSWKSFVDRVNTVNKADAEGAEDKAE